MSNEGRHWFQYSLFAKKSFLNLFKPRATAAFILGVTIGNFFTLTRRTVLPLPSLIIKCKLSARSGLFYNEMTNVFMRYIPFIQSSSI